MRLYDAGLQPERTLLAWRRAALAFCLASAIGMRLTTEAFGPASAVIGIVGIGLAVAAYAGAADRYRKAHRSLTTSGVLAGSAAPLFMLWLAALTAGAAAATYVVAAGARS